MTTGQEGGAALILLAFGIAVPYPVFGGGMLLALGCCYAVRACRPLEARKSLALSLFTAMLAAVLVAGLKEQTAGIWVWGKAPVQFQMATAGALSQAIFELIAARGSGWVGKVADRVGLPGARK